MLEMMFPVVWHANTQIRCVHKYSEWWNVSKPWSAILCQKPAGFSSSVHSDHSLMNNMFIREILCNVLFTINDHSQGSLIILIHVWMCYWSSKKNVDRGMNRLLIMAWTGCWSCILHDNIHIHVIMNIIVTPSLDLGELLTCEFSNLFLLNLKLPAKLDWLITELVMGGTLKN